MFQFTTISAYHSALDAGTVSCKQAVHECLERIETNRNLNAFVQVYPEEALKQAALLDEKRQLGKTIGKLHGVIVSIKDVISYKGHPVSAASKMLSGFTAVYHATAVEKLLAEDAIIIGSCNCDEFAMGSSTENSVYGSTRNPVDSTKVAGGSSGGSAAAVAADLCMVSLGSDTGGSVRQPADFCGIVGYKPAYGTISRHGLIAYASSFDQIGVFARNVEDVETVMAVIAGPDEFDSTVNRKGKDPKRMIRKNVADWKVGILSSAMNHPSLDPEIRKKIAAVTEGLRKEGALVEEVQFDLIDYIVPAYYVLTTAEASANLSRYDGVRYGYRDNLPADDLESFYKHNRSRGFGKEVKKRILLGTYVLSEGYYDAYYTRAQQVRSLLIEETEKIFDQYDLLLMPTTPAPAYPLGDAQRDPVAVYLADIFTVFANLTGLPAISVPLFRHSNGLPFGLQLLSGKSQEDFLLNAASEVIKKYKQL